MEEPTPADSTPNPLLTSAPLRARLSLVEMVYYARPGQNPLTLETRNYRWQATDEQPYVRQLLIDHAWTAIDPGWVKEPGVLHVKNEEGKYTTYPTEEQRLETESKIIELGVVHKQGTDVAIIPFALVYPGFSQRVDVLMWKHYALRCPTGKAQAIVTVLSR